MLQRIRDEAHRFANTFHGERRSKRMTASVLDGIPGLGETRRKRLRQGARRRQRGQARHARGPPGAALAARRRRRRRPRQAPSECSRPSECSEERPRRPHRTARMPTWEDHAEWWIEGSPRGPTRSTSSRSCRWRPRSWPAPAGARRRLRRGSDHPPGGRARRRRARRRHRPDVEPDHGRRRARRRPSGFARAGAERPAVRRRRLRRRRRLPRLRAHRRRRRRRSPRSPGCSRPVVASASSSTTRCSRRRTAAGSTTRCSTRPSSTGGSARTCPEAVDDRGGRAGRPHPLRAPPAVALRERAGRQRSVHRADGRAGAAARLPRPGAGVRARRRPCPACSISGASKTAAD